MQQADGVVRPVARDHPGDPKRGGRERTSRDAGTGECLEAAPHVGVGAVDARTDGAHFLRHPELATEAFGPFSLVIVVDDLQQMSACARLLQGQLTATLHGTDADLAGAGALVDAAESCAGRLIVNGFPTGVEVSPAMNHGGPYPATSDVRFTSVGTAAMLRFARPVCYQGFPDDLLPPELAD